MTQSPSAHLAGFHALGVMASARARTQNTIDDNVAFARMAVERKREWLRPRGQLRFDRLFDGAGRRAESARVDASVDELRRDARTARESEHRARITRLDSRLTAGDGHGFQWQQYDASEFLW